MGECNTGVMLENRATMFRKDWPHLQAFAIIDSPRECSSRTVHLLIAVWFS